jgi:hypothetical protein
MSKVLPQYEPATFPVKNNCLYVINWQQCQKRSKTAQNVFGNCAHYTTDSCSTELQKGKGGDNVRRTSYNLTTPTLSLRKCNADESYRLVQYPTASGTCPATHHQPSKNRTFVVPTNSVQSPATRTLRAEINFNDKLKISDEQVRALAKRKFN